MRFINFSVLYRFLGCVRRGFPWRLALCDVPVEKIPRSTSFGHPYGITMRDDVVFGENCRVYQNVTIGHKYIDMSRSTGRIVIGNNVILYANAIIIGDVCIGDNAVIAAGALVLEDLPANSVYISKRSSQILSSSHLPLDHGCAYQVDPPEISNRSAHVGKTSVKIFPVAQLYFGSLFQILSRIEPI